MGMIEVKELNRLVKRNLYTGEGNQRRENEDFWKDLSREKFEGYEENGLLSMLYKVAGGGEGVERLASLLEWEGEAVLGDILDYIAEHIEEGKCRWCN